MTARPEPARYRAVLLGLALLSLAAAWTNMASFSRDDAWYRQADPDLHNLVDALAINSNVAPARIDQPGFPAKYLLALDFRVRHYAGFLPVWNFKKLAGSPDPLPEIVRLVHIERQHSRLLVILFILSGAGLIYGLTRNPESGCLALILLSASAGLLYHGLLHRPDLLCAWFGLVAGLFCAWRATAAPTARGHHAWLFAAGLGAGLAALTKLPGLVYFPTLYAWCWLAALTRKSEPTAPAARENHLLTALLPVATAAAIFCLLPRLVAVPGVLSPEAILRVRLVAGLAGFLPLLGFWNASSGNGSFLPARARELALLAGGGLAALLLGWAALGTVMSGARAEAYLAGVLGLVFHPDPHLRFYFSATPRVAREFLLFVKDAPFLFAGGLAAAIGLWFAREIPARAKALTGLLFVHAVVLALLLGQRAYLEQFSVFTQVPLILLAVLAVHALGVWTPQDPAASRSHWAVPVVISAALVVTLTAFLRVEVKHPARLPGADLPASNVTLTYLFDHDAHPQEYRDLMQARYGGREEFARALERYLADPAHRY